MAAEGTVLVGDGNEFASVSHARAIRGEQIPRGLTSPRDDNDGRTIAARLKLCPFKAGLSCCTAEAVLHPEVALHHQEAFFQTAPDAARNIPKVYHHYLYPFIL